jgi:hypothetical protein
MSQKAISRILLEYLQNSLNLPISNSNAELQTDGYEGFHSSGQLWKYTLCYL